MEDSRPTTAVTDPKGYVTKYTTNDMANVIQLVEDSAGKKLTTKYEWDDYQNLVSTTDPKTYVTNADYTSMGDLYRIEAPDKNSAIFNYDSYHNVINASDFAKRVTVNAYDSTTRNLVGAGTTQSATIAYRYDDVGNVTEATTPIGMGENLLPNTGFENWSGSLPVYWSKIGTGGTISKDTANKVNGSSAVKLVPDWATVANVPMEPLKAGATYTASAVIKTEGVTGSGALIKIDIYDANNNYLGHKLSRVVSGTSDWTRVVVQLSTSEAKAMYANAAKILPSVGTLGATNGAMYFDAVRMSEPAAETTYRYTSDGNYVSSVTNPLGDVITLIPDPRGNVTQVTDPKNNSANFEYDLLDQLTAAENAGGLRTEYVYDKNGNIIEVINKNQGITLNTTSTQYNELGMVKKVIDPLDRVTSFEYDKNGSLSAVSNPNGKGAVYTYDSLNRLNGVTYTGDSTTWSFAYDNNGNRTSATKNGSQTTTYTFDNRDRVSRVDFPAVNGTSNYVEYQYNGNGQITYVKNSLWPLNPVTYGYDQTGLNATVNDPDYSGFASLVYDDQGRVRKAYYLADKASNIFYITYWNYDPMGRITRLRTEDKTGAVVVDHSYEYDKSGNRTWEYDQAGGGKTEYLYDSINQLTTEKYYDSTGTVTKQITYEYDILGNRTKKAVTTGGKTTTLSWGYNSANETVSRNGSAVYTRDGNGNITSDGTYTYIYDAEDQLIQIKKGSTIIGTYEYDADGLRTKKVAGSTTELYYYNGDDLAYITDANNNKQFFFTRDAFGRLLNMIDSTGAEPATYWYLYDGHGSIIGMADKTGQVVVTYDYDAYGGINTSTGAATTGDGRLLKDVNPFRYAGYFYDKEIGLYYLKSRIYSPTTGRFLTQDAVDSTNLYVYCDNNPINNVDSSGMALETVADIASTGYSGYTFAKRPTLANAGYLIWDVTATLLPVVPGSYVARGARLTKKLPNIKLKHPVCFTGDTLIQTEEGNKIIRDVKPGDKVYSENPETGERGYKEVSQVFVNETDTLIHLNLGDEIIRTTPTHPFWVEGKGWVEAGNLKAGELLSLSPGKTVPVTAVTVEVLSQPITVYNLEVEGWHTYFVSEEHVLVHNMCAKGAGASAYNIAKEGGKHFGFYTQYVGKSNAEIKKGILSLEKQISGHIAKIANPEKYIPNFRQLDPRQQKALLTKKWPGDIQRQMEQKQILEGILRGNN